MKYGWVLQGIRSGLYVKLGPESITAFGRRYIGVRPRTYTTDSVRGATMFGTRQEALDAIEDYPEDLRGHVCVVDATIYPDLPPDADQVPVPTYDEVMERAMTEDRKREAERRANWKLVTPLVLCLLVAACSPDPAFASSLSCPQSISYFLLLVSAVVVACLTALVWRVVTSVRSLHEFMRSEGW